MALGYNNGVHSGLVTEGTGDGRALRLEVNLKLGADRWVPGGRAAYTIKLRRNERGNFEGTFDGTFKGQKFSGRASGEIKPPRPIRIRGFTPLEPGERPRILFRKSDVARLLKKLKTPFGRAFFKKVWQSGDLIGLGILYRLTRDKPHAERALQVMKEQEYIEKIDHHGFGSGGFGHREVVVCLVYDLCYDAWPEDLRKRIEERLLQLIPGQQFHLMAHANFHPCCNYYGPGRAVPAIATMVLWGRKGPAPKKPRDPAEQGRTLQPPKAYKPGNGVPAVDFRAGHPPAKWLYAGPLPFRAGGDVLGALGGYARARPEVGTTTRIFTLVGGRPQEATLTFKPLPQAFRVDAGVDLGKLAGNPKPTTTLLYSVLKVAQGQVVGLVRGHPDSRVWLAGSELNEKDYYKLKPGLYPMLVVHATDRSAGAIAPRLSLAASDDLAQRRADYGLDLAMWQADHEAWEKSGGADPTMLHLFGVSYHQVCRHYRLGIGDGGFQAETGGYASIASWYPLVYAVAYLRMFGRDASPYPDVTHLMPRRMMQVLFRQGGRPVAQKLNSVAGFDARWCAAAFPIAPDKWKPALLWAWNRVTSVTDEKSKVNVLQGEGLNLAHAFLHYPLDMKPVHPSQIMPLVWEAPTFGFHCFRSGWEGKDEFIAQVFLKASPVFGWNHPNAGTFRILGLGHGWVTGPTSRNGVREQENVVLLPEDEINESSCGRLAYLKTQKDGSAVLTIDLDDVYARKSRLYDGNLIRWPERLAKSGIAGLRAMAFDYSGKSGAPAMMVLLDRINGGKKKVWQWHLPKEALANVKIDGNTFALHHGDASMKATFIAPERVKLEAASELIRVRDPRHGFHGQVHRVKATRGDNFFVVITFQRGEPPPVKVEGKGLDATVTVGKQSVRFDGQKIILKPLE